MKPPAPRNRRSTLSQMTIASAAKFSRLALTACLAALATPALLGSGSAKAQPYGVRISPGPFVNPTPGWLLHPPVKVSGKEVSFGNLTALEGDRDASFTSVIGQAVFFDGVPILPQSGLANAFNYGDYQVDALANINDVLFQAVRDDKTWLLFSVQNDKYGNAIFAEAPGGFPSLVTPGKICLWSSKGCNTTNNTPEVVGEYMAGFGPLVKNGNPTDVLDANGVYPVDNKGHLIDVDALEVWGPELSPDANVFSPEGDIDFSVKCVGSSSCHTYTRSEIANALGRPDLERTIDVDGLMTNINNRSDPAGLPYLAMNFSVRPTGGLDGAEIWQWSGVPGDLASPLVHGGHAWDTAFNLRKELIAQGFGDMAITGTPDNIDVNLDATEAVSTPGPLPLLGLVSALGFSRRIRRRIRSAEAA